MPSGLPGFLRRSLRVDYDDEDDEDEEEDNVVVVDEGVVVEYDKNEQHGVGNDRLQQQPNHLSQEEKQQQQQRIFSDLLNSNSSSSIDDEDAENALRESISQHHKEQQEDLYNLQTSASLEASFSDIAGTLSTTTVSNNGLQTSTTTMGGTSALMPTTKKKTYREIQFDKIIQADVINLNELASLAWNGIPIQHRATTWKLLLGYLPTNAARRTAAIRRKRTEYLESCVAQHYDCDDDSRTVQEQETLRQVLVDVPRTQPNVPLFRNSKIKRVLSRLLYIWAMRHPASSYVQGINDLTTPLLAVFLMDYFIEKNDTVAETNTSNHSNPSQQKQQQQQQHDDNNRNSNADTDSQNNKKLNISKGKMDSYDYTTGNDSNSSTQNRDSSRSSIFNLDDSITSRFQNQYMAGDDFLRGLPDLVLEGHVMNHFPDDKLDELEADVYWCLTNLLAGIQDHYTADQPGLQRMVGKLEELVNRIDGELCRHLRDTGILFIQFAFKWMNCLLLREFTLKCIFRLWDTYLSEQQTTDDNSMSYMIHSSSSGSTPQHGFEDFHVYVCAAFLCQFSNQLQSMAFDEMFQFFQDIPTKDWTDTEIEVLLSQAYVLSTLFRGSDAHLTSINPTIL